MVRVSLIATLIICVCISLSIPTAYGQEADFMDDGATIRGEVVDDSPLQSPIEGASVYIVNSNGDTYNMFTDENGAYEKTGLPVGRYMVSIFREGYEGQALGRKVVESKSEIFDLIIMKKRGNIFTFLLDHFFTWQFVIELVVAFIATLLVTLILKFRRLRRRSRV